MTLAQSSSSFMLGYNVTHDSIQQVFSKCSPGTSAISITWGQVKKASSLAVANLLIWRWDTVICVEISPSGNPMHADI